MPTALEHRARRVLATLTVMALTAGLSLVGVLAPAQAADDAPNPVVTVTPSTDIDPTVANQLVVSGTGFTGPGAANGAYVLVGEAGAWEPGTPLPGDGWVAQIHVPAAQLTAGAFTGTVPVAAGALDPTKSYVVATSAAHWLSTSDRSLDTRTPITLKQATPEPTPEPTDPEPTPEPTDPEPSPEPTDPEPTPEPTDPEPSPEPTDPAPVWEPSITLFAADGTTPLGSAPVAPGTTIVVRGTGFDPVGNTVGARPPIASGSPAGTYVVFGKFADQWKPTENAPGASRSVAEQKWALSQTALDQVPGNFQATIEKQMALVSPEGTFSTTLTAAEKDGGWPATGNVGVYTYAASGTKNAAQELYAPVTLATTPVDPEVPVDPETPVVTPAVTVTPSSALDPSVTNVLTVSGTGFAGPGAANGAYVLFGEASVWPTGTPLPGAGWVSQGFVPAPQIRDGAFSTTVTIPAGTLDPSKTYVVATSAAHGLALTDRTMDTRTPVTVKQGTPVEPEVPVDPEVPVPPVDPETPVTPETPVARGTLTWGVKESFRSYIVGPIASGSISVADGATRSGSLFAFPQSSSDVDGTTGTAGYSGSVRFTGHSGALDLTLSNPSVRLTGASTATLVVDAQGISLEGAPIDLKAVDLADLALPASTSSDGVTTWTSAPATLTAAGAEAFSGFYQAGDAIDPVTFTVGASTGTPTEPGTPGTPGEPGLEQPGVVAPFAPGVYANAVASVTAVVAGGEVTFTGQGFGSGTEGIEAAIYSERQLLASGITADAAGQASATVTIPADLTPGVHTLSLESPEGVMSQVQITVEAPVVPTAAQQCVARSVSGATLSWGVKESFRTYITGPIAKGAITPSGVTSSGSSLGWSSGSGKFNSDVDQGRVSFPGSVSFSGHGGILDLTISNVRVQVNSASTGSLIADVASSDMEGTKNQQSGVTIASLNLTGTKSTTGGTVTWTGASASLTSAGASAFGGFYTAGDAMDPVTFAFPLGAEVECDVTSGANGAGALATTGADASVTTGLAAFLTLLAGVGAVALARRQRRTV